MMQAEYNVKKCQENLTSNMDIEHIRKQFLSYYKSDNDMEKVCTLKVLFKALQVSEEEQ